MMRVALCVGILSALVCVGRSQVQTDEGTALSLVSSANKEFSYRLYRMLATHSDLYGKNIFFSPKSVSVALATLSVGARGDTHEQLFTGLGFNSSELTQENVDKAFHTLLERAKKDDTSEGTAVFVEQKCKLQPEFLEVLNKSYFTEGFNVDFTNTVESTNTINSYVAEKTKGKIANLVDQVDESTIMYLISYIYFKEHWETPFDPELTYKDEFMVDENTKVPVDMMTMSRYLDVYRDQGIGTSVLHLPFKGSSSMLLLLPDDMATLEKAICPEFVTKWLKGMTSRKYIIHVPKFSIKTSYKLNDVLTVMGMTDMFDNRADLSGIGAGPLVVSKVVHKATLDVNEAGATATAATAIEILLGSSRFPPEVLKFNRPFMVIITDRVTEDALFVGKITNPNI